MATNDDRDWTKPAAMAIPKEGYFELERGRYGPVFPRTPACHGFSIIAKVKEGREAAVRAYGKTIEETIAAMHDLVQSGKVRYLGIGDVTDADINIYAATGVKP